MMMMLTGHLMRKHLKSKKGVLVVRVVMLVVMMPIMWEVQMILVVLESYPLRKRCILPL